MLQLIGGGALEYAHPAPIDQANVAWELAGQIMSGRTVGPREETCETQSRYEGPSLPAREGPQMRNVPENVKVCDGLWKAWIPRS